MFKNECAVRFVVMVTPEDLKANAGPYCFTTVVFFNYFFVIIILVAYRMETM